MERWLKSYPSVEDRYGHLLLEEKADRDPNLAAALAPCFESAHRDAREHFAEQIGIDLHPDADEDDDDATLLCSVAPMAFAQQAQAEQSCQRLQQLTEQNA
jgi:hypothetical protein